MRVLGSHQPTRAWARVTGTLQARQTHSGAHLLLHPSKGQTPRFWCEDHSVTAPWKLAFPWETWHFSSSCLPEPGAELRSQGVRNRGDVLLKTGAGL
jgi:hypothetical protein